MTGSVLGSLYALRRCSAAPAQGANAITLRGVPDARSPALAASIIMAARVAFVARANLAAVIAQRYGHSVSIAMVLLLAAANAATIAADATGGWIFSVLAKLRCGALSARKSTRAGCGMPSVRRASGWRNVARPWGIQVPLEPLGLSFMGHLMR